MAITTSVQRIAVSQLGGVRQFLAPPSGVFENYDRLLLISLYPFTVSGGGPVTRRRRGTHKWFRNQY